MAEETEAVGSPGCRTRERKVWQPDVIDALLQGSPAPGDNLAIKCVRDYLDKYAAFAEAFAEALKPPDAQVNDLFEDTKNKIEAATKEHGSLHRYAISQGRIDLDAAYRLVPGCQPEQDLRDMSYLDDCKRPRLLFGEEGTPIPVDCQRMLELKFLARTRPFNQKMLKMCNDLGCDETKQAQAHQRVSDSIYRDCWRGSGALDSAAHYMLDQKLHNLEGAAKSAESRLDKVMVIEGFVTLHHHTGPALDFACKAREIPIEGLAQDILDCLAGNDWEKL